jgi:hypothetical protein
MLGQLFYMLNILVSVPATQLSEVQKNQKKTKKGRKGADLCSTGRSGAITRRSGATHRIDLSKWRKGLK